MILIQDFPFYYSGVARNFFPGESKFEGLGDPQWGLEEKSWWVSGGKSPAADNF